MQFEAIPHAALIFAAALFLLLLAICWFLLPFALFGIKPLLKDLIRETQRTNALLEILQAGTRDQERRAPGRDSNEGLPDFSADGDRNRVKRGETR